MSGYSEFSESGKPSRTLFSSQMSIAALLLTSSVVVHVLHEKGNEGLRTIHQRAHDAIIGAMVADAASTGLHYIFEKDELRSLINSKAFFGNSLAPEFYSPPTCPFYDYHVGSQSVLGDDVFSLLKHLADHETFDADAFARESLDAARDSLRRLSGVMKEFLGSRTASARSIQPLSMCKAPIIAARFTQSNTSVIATTKAAAEVHQTIEEAVQVGVVASSIVELTIRGLSVQEALHTALNDSSLSPWVRGTLLDVIRFDGGDPVAHFGQGSALPAPFQGAAALLLRAESFEQAVRANIMAGGDSASRAIVIGAVMGAAHGVPASWKKQVTRIAEIEELAARIVARRHRDSLSSGDLQPSVNISTSDENPVQVRFARALR